MTERPTRWIEEGLDHGTCERCGSSAPIRVKSGLCVPVCEAKVNMEKKIRERKEKGYWV